jgi:hypothetical protein
MDGGRQGWSTWKGVIMLPAKLPLHITVLITHLKIELRLVLLCVNTISYGTQAILAETARTRVEGAVCRLARWRAGWKNLPSGQFDLFRNPHKRWRFFRYHAPPGLSPISAESQALVMYWVGPNPSATLALVRYAPTRARRPESPPHGRSASPKADLQSACCGECSQRSRRRDCSSPEARG